MNMMTGTALLDVAILIMLFILALGIIRMRSLFAIVMMSGAYSLLSAAWFVVLDAVDVAFTEAAVGAGVSTVLMLGAMLLTSRRAKPTKKWLSLAPLAICLITGSVLIYATIDLPPFGDALSPANAYVGAEYLASVKGDIDVPNVVTAVLASYRGFDTLGEVVVVFTACMAVVLLLGFGERSLSASKRTPDGGKD